MIRSLYAAFVGALIFLFVAQAQALDINLLNIDLNGPEGRQAAQLYGNSYGFSPEQVMPALLGPAEEVPAILRIAQAAGTVPMSVWMMRKMGMSYSRILQNFALAPATLLGGSVIGAPSVGYSAPLWSQVLNPFYIQSSRTYFLRDVLRVDPIRISSIPWRGIDFTRAVLLPQAPVGRYWLPPGQAKKVGLWLPPGQAKKHWVSDVKWKRDDDNHFDRGRRWPEQKHVHEKGNKGWKKHGKGHGGDD